MQRGFSRRQKDVSRLMRDRKESDRARLEWERRKFNLAAPWRPKAR